MVRYWACNTPVLEDYCSVQHASERDSMSMTWITTSVSAFDLAAAGLYNIAVNDLVKCAYYALVLGEWLRGDNAKDEHRRH